MQPKTLFIPLSLGFLLSGCQTLEGIKQDFNEWLPETKAATAAPAPAANAPVYPPSAEVYYSLGLRYANGVGGTPDAKAACDAYQKAADLGHPEAQQMLGFAYLAGEGVPQSYSKANLWLSKAASAGLPKAQYALGDLLINGRGVKAETAWGVHWIGRAANQGDTDAQYKLAIAWATGLGLPKNNNEAWFWAKLAAKQGHKDALLLADKLSSKLNTTSRKQLAQQVKQWQPTLQESNHPRPQVRFIQFALNQLGYRAGTVDGWLGPKSNQAIESYKQERLGFPSRTIDERLLNALRKELAD